MVRKVYRVLDRSFSLFGLQGRYVYVFLASLGVGALLSFIVGTAAGTIIGSAMFVLIAIVMYFCAMMLQSFYSERDIEKFIGSRRLKDFIVVKPVKFSKQWK